MSGYTKRVLYTVCTLAGFTAAFILAILGLYFSPQRNWLTFSLFNIIFLLLPLNVLMHELGHVFFGLCVNMKFVSLKLGRFLFFREKKKLKCRFCASSVAAGESALFPKTDSHVRSRFLAATLGGAIFNFAYGIVFLLLYFLAKQHPALLFFEMFAPLSLMEGIAALIPVELDAGKTDGLVVLGLMNKFSEEEIALRVLRAQGILYRKTFSEVPHALLFDVPVVREDLPALHALLLLRIQSLLWEGDEEGAKAILYAAEEWEMEKEDLEEFVRYQRYFEGEFTKENSPMYGVRLLEDRLAGERKA